MSRLRRWRKRAAERCSCRPWLGYVCTAEQHHGEFDEPCCQMGTMSTRWCEAGRLLPERCTRD